MKTFPCNQTERNEKNHEVFPLQININAIYYKNSCEIPGFLLLLKNHIFIARSNILFLSFTCEDIAVAIITKMITIAMVSRGR